MSRWKTKRFLHIALALLVGIGLIYFFFYSSAGIHLKHWNMHEASRYVRELGPLGKVIGALAVFFQTYVPIVPFVAVASINVAALGMKWGFVVNYTMSCAGAASCFWLVRRFGRSWGENRLHRYSFVKQFSDSMEKRGFLYVLIGRLIPVFPSSAINVGAALTGISFRHFLLATLLGKLPMVYLETMIAHDLLHLHVYKKRLLLLTLLFIALLVVGNVVKRKLASAKK